MGAPGAAPVGAFLRGGCGMNGNRAMQLEVTELRKDFEGLMAVYDKAHPKA